jgi:hypothetical protein
LATAIVAGQFYPILKRGLGHAYACAPVVRELLALQHDGRSEAALHRQEATLRHQEVALDASE